MPTSREVQDHRRETIRDILVELDIRSQQELLDELERRGIRATQSSISRDLTEIGAVRLNGLYILLGYARGLEGEFRQVIDFIREVATAGACITIMKTDPDAGPLVARAIEAGKWPEVAGTLAGPDSLLVITDDSQDDQGRLWQRLDRLLGFDDEDEEDEKAAALGASGASENPGNSENIGEPGERVSRPSRRIALLPRSPRT